VYTYPPLNSSEYYLPPRTNHTGDVTCDCNTVMYSLYMACAACQTGETYPWPTYITQCTSIMISAYPVDIAQGTAVPHWAYIDVTQLPNSTWSANNSMTVGRDPEVFPKAINTVSGGSSSTIPKSTITKTSGSSGPTSSTNTKGGTNVGAIVGGVVGSIVPLTILAIAIALYMRKRRQQSQPSHPGFIPNLDDEYKGRPVSYTTPAAPFTPYNPSDPSTFPPQSPPTSVAYTTQPVPARGQYSGMPEV
jgi:hypothetical protein